MELNEKKKKLTKKKIILLGVAGVVFFLLMGSCLGKKASNNEYGELQWPESELAKLIPVPKSNKGTIIRESEDSFYIDVAKITKKEYAKYVAACAEKGFDVDYSKTDTTYYADNADGYSLKLFYQDNDVMSISLDSPEEDSSEEVPSEKEDSSDEPSEEPSSDENSDTVPEAEENTDSTVDDNAINPEFKEVMDEYEAFVDDYVAFMEKYQNSDDITAMVSDYADYMKKYAELTEKVENIDTDNLTTAEALYYSEVMTRVSEKLLNAAVTE